MASFIQYIIILIRDIRFGIRDGLSFIYGSPMYDDVYLPFLQKNVFTDTSLIGFNLTWFELFHFIFLYVLIFLCFYLFIKFICKIFTIFRV